MNIRLGVSLVCDRIREFPAWVRAIEAAGFDAIGFGDSPSLYPETYVQATIVALNTSRVMFGPRVTNPLTRHPSVTASGITAADELSGGRAMLGIGTGDSAIFNIGEKPATLKFMREYIVALKEMFAKGHTTYQGKRVVFTYTRRRIPIYMAASGPNSLRLAGEICDGVILGGGIQRDLIPLTHKYLREGARKAGKRLEDLDIWWLIGASIAPTKEQAVDNIKTHLAAATNASFRLGVKEKGLPDKLIPAIQKLIQQYDFSEHEHSGSGKKNVRMVDELGLTEYLADRFTIAGPPEEFARRVRDMASWGANQLWFTMPLPGKYGFLDAMRDGVMPRLRG
ncbi:MAG: LLM class flavin-dependent oxidoreductase [Dehalococcoidia bacterium]|nr:LLM class flavin-dependent oxidoreductase [Dehalococcoidia bacterium]